MQPKISAGQDESKVKAELQELVQSGWQLDHDIQLEKTYSLKSYRHVKVSERLYITNKANSLQFLTLEIMSRSQVKNHHPVLKSVRSRIANPQFKAYHLADPFLSHRLLDNP